MQQSLSLLGNIEAPMRSIPSAHVAACRTEQDAYRLCVKHHPAHLSSEAIAEKIGLTPDKFNKALNTDHYLARGKAKAARYLPGTVQRELEKECRNTAIRQWLDLYEAGLLNCQRSLDDRRAQLLAELAEIDRSAS